MARNDLMTALLDTRRALEEQFAALGERVESMRREVVETATAQGTDLHADNRETRNRVNSMSTAVSEINRSVPALRQEVADLTRSLETLRATVDDIALRLTGAPGQPPAGTRPSNEPEPDSDRVQFPSVSGAAELPPAIVQPVPPAPEWPQASRPETAAVPVGGGSQAGRQQEAPGPPAAEPNRRDDTDHAHDAELMERRATSAQAGPDDDAKHSLARHDNILRSAATVGTVEITCHRELWEFVQERATNTPHFHAPATLVEEGGDRVRAALSGRSVIGVLIAMRTTAVDSAPYGKDDGTWNLARAVYDRLAHDLTTTSRHGSTPLAVVFDDGATPDPTPANES